MNSVIPQHIAPWLLAHIAEPAVRSLLLGLIAALVLAVCRARGVSVRLAVWTTVLYGALAMPFLGGVLPALRLQLPTLDAVEARVALLPARNGAVTSPPFGHTPAGESHALTLSSTRERREAARTGVDERVSAARNAPSASQFQAKPLAQHGAGAAQRSSSRSLGVILLACLYLVAVGLLLARVTLGIVLRRRLQRGALIIEDPRARTVLQQSARALGMTNLPALAESKSVAVPATLGVRRPAILLPPGWRQWEDAKLGAVLAHELAHVKWHDALTQLLSAIHCSAFWFSPLAWWLDSKLAELAEEASDEAALRSGAERTYYAEVLLHFFAILGTAGRRVRWEAISLVQGSRAERRLDRIFRADLRGRVGKPALCLLIGCAAPVIFLAAVVRPSTMRAQVAPAPAAQPLPPAQAAPQPAPNQAVPPAPMPPAAPNPRLGRTVFPKGIAHQVPSLPPASPQPASEPVPAPAVLAAMPPLPAAPQPPAPPGNAQASPRSPGSEPGSEFSYQEGGSDYAVVSGNSVFVSGSQGERDEVDALRSKIKVGFIWFRHDAKSYVIEDPATVQEATESFAPEQELGREQAALGRQQAALGRQQAALGRRMRSTPVQIPSDLVAQLEELESKIKELGTNADQQELGRLQGELGRLQGELGRLQSEAGRRDGVTGRQMGALGSQQGALGREQGRLGRQQARMARQANREVRRIIDRALARGLAKPLP